MRVSAPARSSEPRAAAQLSPERRRLRGPGAIALLVVMRPSFSTRPDPSPCVRLPFLLSSKIPPTALRTTAPSTRLRPPVILHRALVAKDDLPEAHRVCGAEQACVAKLAAGAVERGGERFTRVAGTPAPSHSGRARRPPRQRESLRARRTRACPGRRRASCPRRRRGRRPEWRAGAAIKAPATTSNVVLRRGAIPEKVDAGDRALDRDGPAVDVETGVYHRRGGRSDRARPPEGARGA